MKGEKRVYTVATAHLDTIWNWDFEHTVSKCLKDTLKENFYLFDKYPNYKFNFEGSYRYELMEEYFPEDFEKLKQLVAKGRWNVAGSSYENGDVNVPSPEALFRNILIGNEYFDKTFGKRSKDIFLPDCFGFGWALPSIAKHANLKGFSTQKLNWGSAYGTPFDIGVWKGVNGEYIYACVDPHSYSDSFKKLRGWKFMEDKLEKNESFSLNKTYLYHGVGDQGGAPKEISVQVLSSEMDRNDASDIKITSDSSDAIFYDLEKERAEETLPVWNNELVMRNHAVGGYTSRAISKRWSRKSEELLNVAERLAAIADLAGIKKYPKNNFDFAWKKTIAHQFHDDITGTSVQRAYRRSWNDYGLALNVVKTELSSTVAEIAAKMDYSFVTGKAIAVYNGLEFSRSGEINLDMPVFYGKKVAVYGADGKRKPTQTNKDGSVSFIADVQALSISLFDVRVGDGGGNQYKGVAVDESKIENAHIKVSVNANGEVSGIYEKDTKRELLSAPLTFDIYKYTGSKDWPAWELNYKEVNVDSTLRPRMKSIEVIKSGEAVGALRITSVYDRSTFVTTVSLEANSRSVKFQNEVVWHGLTLLLKNRFCLDCSNALANFDLGLGEIKRGNMSEKLFEVPAQRYAAIEDARLGGGVMIASDCKYGWDKRSDNELRMTVVHTPLRNYRKDSMQSLMDLGLNRYGFCVYGFSKDGYAAAIREAESFSSPLYGFSVAHPNQEATLKSVFRFGELSEAGVALRAVKKAENSDEIVVRFCETDNRTHLKVSFSFADGILSARSIYASEEHIGAAKTEEGKLIFSLKPYEVASFALSCRNNPQADTCAEAVALPYDTDIYSRQGEQKTGINGYTLPYEAAVKVLETGGVSFAPETEGKGALLANGQKIPLTGKYGTLSLICASLAGDGIYLFSSSESESRLSVADAFDYPFKWDLYGMNETANIKNVTIAKEFTHLHKDGKDEIAKQMFFYRCDIETNGANEIVLPQGKKLIILAATEHDSPTAAVLAPLWDEDVKQRTIDFKLTGREKLRQHYYKAVAEMHK